MRLDKYLLENNSQEIGNASRSQVAKAIKKIGLKPSADFEKVQDRFDLKGFENALSEVTKSISQWIQPQVSKDFESWIVQEDDDTLVINKPHGVVVHPGIGNDEGTIANYIKGYLGDSFDPEVERAGIVHRLDKGVGGFMVIAKNRSSQLELKKQFEEHTVDKIYKAIIDQEVESTIEASIEQFLEGFEEIGERVEGFIRRDPQNRKRNIFEKVKVGKAKSSLSFIVFTDVNEVLVKIETGRMHQIRASLKYLGYTIKGDDLYSKGKLGGSLNISLESVYLSFTDRNGKKKIFKK